MCDTFYCHRFSAAVICFHYGIWKFMIVQLEKKPEQVWFFRVGSQGEKPFISKQKRADGSTLPRCVWTNHKTSEAKSFGKIRPK